MSQKIHRFELLQNGMVVAAVEGRDLGRMRAEIMHYARLYRQDGPCQIRGEDVMISFPQRVAEEKVHGDS